MNPKKMIGHSLDTILQGEQMNKQMTRRAFLQGTGTAASAVAGMLAARPAVAAVASSPKGSAAVGKVNPKRWRTAVGLNGYVSSARKYGYKYKLPEILKLVKECGYEGVELFPWDAPYPTTPDGIRALKEQYDVLGLQIISLQARSRGIPGSADSARRQRYLSDVKQQVDLLHEVGSEFIGCWSGGRAGQASEEYCKWLADTWARLAEYAGEQGMYMVTEPEPVLAIHTLELLGKVVKWIGSPHFKLIMDPSHSSVLGGGDPFIFLERFKGRIGHVHFTDADGTRREDRTSKHMTWGDGKMDMVGILRELKNQNYDKWIMMDLWQIPDIYRATIVGKQKLDAALDEIFSG